MDKIYLQELLDVGLNVAIFSKDKKPITKQFFSKKYTTDELETALKNGFLLAIVNNGEHSFLDFDRGNDKTEESDKFKNKYRKLLLDLADYFNLGLHESVNGFHILGLPSFLLQDFCEDEVKVTPRTKNQCLLLPWGRGIENGVLRKYPGATRVLSMVDFLKFLYEKNYIDGFVLECALESYAKENGVDFFEICKNVFGDRYDEKRTNYMMNRDVACRITFGSIFVKLPDLFSHILKRLLPEKETDSTSLKTTGEMLLRLIESIRKKLDTGIGITDGELVEIVVNLIDEYDTSLEALDNAITFFAYDMKKLLKKKKMNHLISIFESLKTERIREKMNKANHRVALRRLRKYILSLERKPLSELKGIFEKGLNKSLSQVEYEMLLHWFTNLKRAIIHGEDILDGVKLSKKFLPYKVLLNFYGPQEYGKSMFFVYLSRYLDRHYRFCRLTMVGNAKTIFEDRHTNAYSNYQILNVLDELAYLEKTDQNLLKSRLDQEESTNRDLHSSKQTYYKNISSLAGTSNRHLADIINDDTGARRYCEICLVNKLDKNIFTNEYFDDIFSRIDENNFDTYTDLIRLWQIETLQPKRPLELFAEHIVDKLTTKPKNGIYVYKVNESSYECFLDWMKPSEIYSYFKEFCENYKFNCPNLYTFGRWLAESSAFEARISNGMKQYKISGHIFNREEQFI